jgi:hypothetical protein
MLPCASKAAHKTNANTTHKATKANDSKDDDTTEEAGNITSTVLRAIIKNAEGGAAGEGGEVVDDGVGGDHSCFSGGDACAAGCCSAASVGGCRLVMATAAVQFKSGTDIVVQNCTFSQLGAWGLAVTYGAKRTEISRSTFTDCSGGGVYLGNVNETRASDPTVYGALSLLGLHTILVYIL